MTKLLLAMLLLLAIVTALLLGEGYLAGLAIGGLVVVPFCFVASLLFASVIGLDRRVHQTENHPPTQQVEKH